MGITADQVPHSPIGPAFRSQKLGSGLEGPFMRFSISAVVIPCDTRFSTFIMGPENLLCCALAVMECILILGVPVSPEIIVINYCSQVGKRGLRL